ncbi:MAG: hypothetical protein K1V80_08650 [Muribaculaceae bacterium]
MSPWPRPQRAPWWFTLLLIIIVLPGMAFIPQASAILEDARWLGTSYVGWLYPVYILLSAVIAWVCYPQRRTIAWILVALIVITMAGLFVTIGLV